MNNCIHVTAKNGKNLTLDHKHFYVDGSLDACDVACFKFKTIHSAVAAAENGTEAEPMVIYIEPDVYQMNGTLTDCGLYVDKDWVSFTGLADDARDVVIADNRGHTIGTQTTSSSSPAQTIVITGTGFHAENLTFGNYCNVDLVYPKDSGKNQLKRSSTITQAYCISAGNRNKTLDKFHFRNVRFISMLDTLALGGVQRVYYEDCYVQGTDDYMGGGSIQVMRNSTLHCFSSKPIYMAGRNGMAFINCKWEIDFLSLTDLTITKVSSTLYLINCSFIDLNNKLKSVQWAPYPAVNIKSYTYNTTLNGKPYTILPEGNGVELAAEQLKVYSTYNFLKSSDNWDPANEKDACTAYSNSPLNISIAKSTAIRTGEDTTELAASVFPVTASQDITWSINSKYALLSADKGTTVTVKGNNNLENPIDVVITAAADNGVSNSSIITVYPSLAEAPGFIKTPVLMGPETGQISVDYTLDLSYPGGIREDESIITWYRCDDESGANAVEIAVSRLNKPLVTHTLTSGDVNHYMMASVAPKHLRSNAGETIEAISSRSIIMNDLAGKGIEKFNFRTDFVNLPTAWQPQLISGTWTVDTYYPLDQYIKWAPADNNPWEYAAGLYGAASGYGLLTAGRGARLLYTQDGEFGDMAVHLEVNPEKTAAQGFGSANGQYLEVYIKYKTGTKTGYALRIERTIKYGNATDFTLYEYTDGIGKPISDSVSSAAFNPGCIIDLWVESSVLYAKAVCAVPKSSDQTKAGLPGSICLSAEISGNTYGGTGIQHTGTTGPGGRIQLKTLSVSYH